MECVYADRAKEGLQLVGQPVWLQKWQHWCDFGHQSIQVKHRATPKVLTSKAQGKPKRH
jgi:hypothetical protein